ncbi:hypothetical protein QR680_013653 [Steinernema hermaphroditum]|uniref:Uncharacterized protein n=1 Tax=Steinernema hermaphroditum TaxID=289476 RepID=A0AA39M2V2_9BILA|nr:hypothetical protein QR680_013653 [Steinernema hermaphroditum]
MKYAVPIFLLLFCFSPLSAQFTETSVEFTVSEDAPPGQLIGRVPLDPLRKYRLNGASQGLVSLDAATGDLRTVARIDREQVARLDLVLVAQPAAIITVTVKVADVNDNAPTFPTAVQNLSIIESAAVGSRLVIQSAVDSDEGENGTVVAYSLSGETRQNLFRLVRQEDVLFLELTEELDREERDLFVVNVTAQDGGHPPRYGSTTVYINVVDANDNSPAFNSSHYEVEIVEGETNSTPILTVHADDADLGDNARVSYRIINDPLKQFSIDPTSGEISVAAESLNCSRSACERENCTRMCVFTVEAEDYGIPKLTGRAFVDVKLIDSNAHEPKIVFKLHPTGIEYCSVLEKAPVGSTIAVITVVDEDFGENGRANISIVSGNEDELFKLESGTNFAILRLNGTLNVKRRDRYQIDFEASDNGKPKRSSRRTLQIYVRSSDDRPPSLGRKTTYHATVSEDAPMGSVVSFITAKSDFSPLTYSVVAGNEEGVFDLDEFSGLITLAKTSPPAEYHLNMTVKNPTPSVMFTNYSIVITVIAANRNAPEFEDDVYEFIVSEASKIGDTIGFVKAIDHDGAHNGRVSYRTPKSTVAKINETTGELKLAEELDFETRRSYSFQVVAFDHGTPSKESTVTVGITVADANDNSPFFDIDHYVGVLRTSEAVGTKIVRVKAEDEDLEDYGRLLYRILSAPVGLFDIDGDGSLTLRGNVESMRIGTTVEAVVGAVDRGQHGSSNNATVTLKIVDDMAVLPDFEDANWHPKIPENGPVREIIGRYRTSDKSAQSRLIGMRAREWVQMDEEGNLRMKKSLDREEVASIDFVVISGFVMKRGTVAAVDKNDNAPKFALDSPKKFVVHETSTIGEEIGRVSATDADAGQNGEVRYSTDSDTVVIDPLTGVLSVRKRIVDEEVIEATVTAQDQGKLAMSATLRITVKVDNSTKMHSFARKYVFRLAENAEIGTVIYNLNPQNDSDRYVFYSTHMKDNSGIGVFPNGEVFVRRHLDREVSDTVSLEVGVEDKIRNNRYTTSVIVYLEDLNDNRPQCPTQSKYFVPENTAILSAIGDLSGTDQDQGLNGLLIHKLINDDRKFLLDEKTGVLRNLIPLDFESKTNSFQLRYMISDYGSPPLSTECSVTVIVTDVNDHPPRFRQPIYYTRKDRVTVDAKDLDFEPLKYGIVDWYGKFQINPSTGLVTTTVPLQSGLLYNLTVIATDSGEPSLSSNVTVLFEAEEVEEKLRFYEDLPERITVSEDTPVGTRILEVKANKPVYLNENRHFQLEPYDGFLIVARPLDYEKDRNFTVFLNEFHKMVIEVANVNDNAPEIETDFIRVAENHKIREEIRVSDADGDEVTVFLYETGEEGLFRLENGFLTSDRSLDREENDQYQLLLVAIDKGIPPLKTQKMITVVVADENDNEPECLGTNAFVEGRGEMRIVCKDRDFGANASLGFSSQGAIFVDQDGMLRPNGALQEPVYNFFVNVFDRNTVEGTTGIDLYRKTTQLPVTLIRLNPTGHLKLAATTLGLTLNRTSPLHTVIGQITVSQGVQPVEFFLSKFEAKPRFAALPLDIDRRSGHLRVSRKIDLEVEEMTLEVTAVDGAGSTDSAQVNIRILNDDPGAFSLAQNSYYFEILEAAAVGSTIGQISIIGRPTLLRYSFKHFTFADFPFSINNQTGRIRLDRRLSFAKSSNYRTSISIISSTLSVLVPVFINILPADNEPPKFAEHKRSLFIREGLPPGSLIGQVTVEKPGQVRYELTELNEKIFLDSVTGVILSNQTFDRESRPFYHFIVVAKDGYGNKATQEVDLYVDDLNDNPPVFDEEKYLIHVPEDTEVGAKLLKFGFKDRDLDNDFRFTVSTSGNEYGIFDIDPEGNLVLVRSLDRETKNTHKITVILEDQVPPNPVHRVETTAEITVLDVNDNAAVIPSNLVFPVFSNSREDTVIGIVTADDPDLGLNGLVNFRLLPESHPEQVFYVDALLGYIRVLRSPSHPEYHFTVEAFDNGTPRKKSYANVTVVTVDYVSEDYSNQTRGTVKVTVKENAPAGHLVTQIFGRKGQIYRIQSGNELGHFRVHPESGCLLVNQLLDYEEVKNYKIVINEVTVEIMVEDVNDEYPVFVDGQPVRFSVAENLAGPYPIVLGSTIAEDRDTGANGEVAYSIVQGDTDLFGIDSRSGLLYLNKGLDREDKEQYEITVQATDLGTPRLASTAEVVVTVVDVNDNAPVFEQPYYVERIEENLPPGEVVARVVATDRDVGVNARIRYTLMNQPLVPFIIGHTSGLVTTTESLDREKEASYYLQVVATDNGGVYQRSTVVNLTVVVKDVNDNSPVILNKQFDVFVPGSLRKGDFVYVVDAFDMDEDQRLQYSLLGGDRSLFSIDQNGVVRTSNLFSSKSVYSVLVTVSDSGDRNTTVSLSFYTAEDRMFPKFQDFESKYRIAEDTKDKLLFQAKTDSSRVVYSIAAGDPFGDFEMEPLRGKVFVRSVDRETRDSYRIFVAASFLDSATYISYKEITVEVEDLNDNAPEFERVLYKAKVFENEMSPMKLLKVKATDRDEGENAKIAYRIADGNVGNRFKINEGGQITVVESLDREEVEVYRLTVEAYNPNSSGQSQIAVVEITVEDENDNSPKFSRLFHAEVAEDSHPGTFIIQVTSTDPDSPEHSRNRYSLEGEDSDVFSIDSLSGNVTLARNVDRESRDEYRIRVKASDGFWQVTTTLTITVTDVNDNAPMFVKDSYEISANRNTATGTVVDQVTAYDIDSGLNAEVRYRFLEESRAFRIDPKSGIIYSILSLRDSPDAVRLQVVAEDEGIPSRSSVVPLTLYIVGNNEHEPEFDEKSYEFPISEEMKNGTVIGKVEAVDGDRGRPGTVRYSLTSKDGDFAVNETTGVVTYISGPAKDQELLLKAYDLGAPSKTTTVTVKVKKVDNTSKTPEFSKKLYTFASDEAMKVEASGRGVRYFLKSTTLPFSINSASGVITPKGQIFGNQSFTVVAESFGWPKLKSKATVRVYSNPENSPIRHYKITLREDARIGTVVARIEGSENSKIQKPFSIDSASGEVTVHQELEARTYRIYVTGTTVSLFEIAVLKSPKFQPKFSVCLSRTTFLSRSSLKSTIIGHPTVTHMEHAAVHYFGPVSDQVTVDPLTGNLLLEEMADQFTATVMAASGRLGTTAPDRCVFKFQAVDLAPTPVFNKTYSVTVPEDVALGARILDTNTVVPRDARLEIIAGNREKRFCLDQSGALMVCGPLDREKTEKYELEVAVMVKDQIRSHTVVRITVDDVNDNAPYLEDGNSVAFVLENTKPGAKILTLKPKDRDLPLNQAKFSFSSEDSEFFEINEEGVVSTKKTFDREKRALYRIPVKISDFGTPRRTTTTVIRVIVDDQDDNLPSSGPVNVHIATNKDAFSGRIVAAGPRDLDTVDYSTCSLEKSSSQFNYSSSCSLIANEVKTSSSYQLSGKTEKNFIFPINLSFYRIPKELKSSAVTVTLDAVEQSMADLVASLQESLPDMKVVPVGTTVLPTYRNRLFFAFVDRNGNTVNGEESAEIMKNHLKKRSIFPDATVSFRGCSKKCENKGFCERSLEEGEAVELRGFSSVFVVPGIEVIERCVCPKLVKGEFCEEAQPSCADKSSGGCRNQGICDPQKAVCICPKGFAGSYCEEDVDECRLKDACPSTSTCKNLFGSFQCICNPGYSGEKCEVKAKTCGEKSTICHRGSCDDSSCICEAGWTGPSCDQRLLSFGPGSHIEVQKMDVLSTLSFQIMTKHVLGLIFYSIDPQDSNRFMALDIANGRLRFSQNLTRSGYTSTILESEVDTGFWKQVTVAYRDGAVSVSMDNCDETSKCERCTKSSCKATVYLPMDRFDVPGNTVILGGTRDLSDISRLSRKVTADFLEGCLRDLKINERPLEAFSNSQVGLLDFCPLVQKKDYCMESDACSGGTCINGWTGPKCLCDGFEAKNCALAQEPVTLEDAGIRYSLSKASKKKVSFVPIDMVVSDEPCIEGQEDEEEKFEDGVSTQALEIDFKTQMENAVIVTVVYKPKTATLQIRNGTLRYSIHHNERLLFEVVNDVFAVSDDKWHRAVVDIGPNGRAVRLSLDGHHRTSHSGFSYPQFVSAAVDSITLGGAFSGCLKRFVVFDQSQPLVNRLDARLDGLQYLENVGRSRGPVTPGCDCDKGDVEFFQGSVFPFFLFGVLLLLLIVVLVLTGILLFRRFSTKETPKPKRVATDCVRTIDSLFQRADGCNYNDAFDILSTTTTHRADSLPHIYEVPPEPPAFRKHHKQPRMGTSPLNTVLPHRNSARELKQAVRESVASARNAVIPLSTSESESESYRTRSRSRSRRSKRRPLAAASTSTVNTSLPSASTPMEVVFTRESDGYDAVSDNSSDYMRPRRPRPVPQEHCRVQYL